MSIKKVITLFVIALILLSALLLWQNNGAFVLYVAIGITAVILDMLILLFARKPSFSMAFWGLLVSGIVCVYGIGYLVKFSCPMSSM